MSGVAKPITVRLDDQMRRDLSKACDKIGCTTTEFVKEAIAWALENEKQAVHTPLAVENARIKIDKSGRVAMPMRRQIPTMAQSARRG